MKSILVFILACIIIATMVQGQSLTGVQMITPYGFAVGASGTILFSADSGKTWTPQSSGASVTLTSVSFFDKDTGVAVGCNALFGTHVILRTINHGQTWTPKADGISLTALNGVACFTGSIIVAVGKSTINTGLIIRSTDRGGTWASIATAGNNPLYSVTSTSSTVGYAVGWAGEVLKTTDGGATWSGSAISGTDIFLHISFSSSNTGFIVGTTGTLFKTTNAGGAWTELHRTASGTADYYGVYAVADTAVFISGGSGFIGRSLDGGTTIVTQSSGSPYALQGISCLNGNIAVVVGGGGVPIRTTDGGSTWGNGNQASCTTVPAAPTLLSPANGSTGMALSFTVSWTATTCAKNYAFYLVLPTGVVKADSPITGTSYTVSGLSANTTYGFYVRAFDDSGASAASTQWKVTTASAGPVCSVTPATYDFGHTRNNVTVTSPAPNFTIKNTGGSDLIVYSVSSDNAKFLVSLPANTIVRAGSQISLPVKFTPTSGSGQTAHITVNHNAAGLKTIVVATGS